MFDHVTQGNLHLGCCHLGNECGRPQTWAREDVAPGQRRKTSGVCDSQPPPSRAGGGQPAPPPPRQQLFSPLNLSKFGAAPSLDPASCSLPRPPSCLPEGLPWGGFGWRGGRRASLEPPGAARGGNPLLPLMGWKLQVFLLEGFGFHVAECSSLLATGPSLPAGHSSASASPAGGGAPLPSPLPGFIASKAQCTREARRQTGNSSDSPILAKAPRVRDLTA